jgi:hypothetical protein
LPRHLFYRPPPSQPARVDLRQERDKLAANTAAVRVASDVEAREFEAEWKSLGDTLNADLQTHETLSKQFALRADGADSTASNDGDDGEQGRRLRSARSGRPHASARGGGGGGGHDASFNSPTEALARLVASAGLGDVSELVRTFVDDEAATAARRDALAALVAELEACDGGAADLRAEIERYKGSDRGADTQRRKLAKDLEAKVRAAEARAEAFGKQHDGAAALIASLGRSVEELCAKIGCNMAFLKEVGGAGVVDESNLMVYLGVIEQRTNEVLRIYASMGAGGGGGGERRRGGGGGGGLALDGMDENNRTFLTAGGGALSARVGRSATPRDATRCDARGLASPRVDACVCADCGARLSPSPSPPRASASVSASALWRCASVCCSAREVRPRRSPPRWRWPCRRRMRTTTTTTMTTVVHSRARN